MRLMPMLLLILASAAFAADGVLEINQTCAVQTGCFAGDTAGLPVTITASGSYRLTSNLTVPDENTTAIMVDANDVGIDLGDFTIQGPVVCSRLPGSSQPLSCSLSSGSGTGIERASLSVLGTSVANGSITGMGGYGLLLGGHAEVTGLRLRWNRLTGISAGSGSTVSDDTAYENGGDGIFAGEGSTVSANTVYQNGGDGIRVNPSSTVSGNTATDNGGVGISANLGSSVMRNTVGTNTGFGLLLAAEAAYRENVITSNMGGTVSGGVNLGANSCNGSPTCP
jgi:parallel beta-helix repeat protein